MTCEHPHTTCDSCGEGLTAFGPPVPRRDPLSGNHPVPTVCEVCGKLADGEPGRCHLHFRMSHPPTDQGLAAVAEWPCQKYEPPHDCGRVTGNAPLPCGPCTARAARLVRDEQIERTATNVAEAIESVLRPALVVAIEAVGPRSDYHYTVGYVNAILAAIPDAVLATLNDPVPAAVGSEK